MVTYGTVATAKENRMKTIDQPHCQSCGKTDEVVEGARYNDGYTVCCNERIIWPQDTDQGLNFYTGRRLTAPWKCDPEDCYHD